ncbi:IMP 5'-nucleotidase [Hypoxylon texense]
MKFSVVSLIAALASVAYGAAVPAEGEIDHSPHWPPHPTTTVASSSSAFTSSSFTFIITTLPHKPTSSSAIAACPTVTHTTRPADCSPMQCPVPGCTWQQELLIPCGCAGVKTALFVDGCQTACPEGCITRLKTVTAACATATPSP